MILAGCAEGRTAVDGCEEQQEQAAAPVATLDFFSDAQQKIKPLALCKAGFDIFILGIKEEARIPQICAFLC